MNTNNLPPLPVTNVVINGLWEDQYGPYTDEQMREYGQLCRQQALARMSATEACAAIPAVLEYCQQQERAIAKKDAALKACVEQNEKLKRSLIRWREKEYPGTDQKSVVEGEYPDITKTQGSLK